MESFLRPVGSPYSLTVCAVHPDQISYLRVVIHFGVDILVIPACTDPQASTQKLAGNLPDKLK
jgi:hypothetical protein